MKKTTATKTVKTPTRQDTYYETQTKVLQALDALKNQVLAHGAPAAAGQYHWGHIGDLTAILAHLQNLPISMTPR